MQVTITHNDTLSIGRWFQADCGKISAYVCFSNLGYIRVCCKNTMDKVGSVEGRFFQSIDEALAAYKSAEMKAIITASMEA